MDGVVQKQESYACLLLNGLHVCRDHTRSTKLPILINTLASSPLVPAVLS